LRTPERETGRRPREAPFAAYTQIGDELSFPVRIDAISTGTHSRRTMRV
jgi:hypothetical protein